MLKHLPGYLKPVATSAYITDWRTQAELLTRMWKHVDFDNGWLRLDPGETKNSDGRMFPLTPELRIPLESQRERIKLIERAYGKIIPWIFTRDDGRPIGKGYRYTWRKAVCAAGLPGKLMHDFRRTAVRNLERAGVPRSASMSMTGYLTESIFRRYAIVDESMLLDAAKKLEALHAFDAASANAVEKNAV